MTPFFTQSRLSTLQAAVGRWAGTPFVPDSAAPGPQGGVDCLRLVEEVMLECGVVAERGSFPVTPMDWSLHVRESKILPWLQGRSDSAHSRLMAVLFEQVALAQEEDALDPRQAQAGDLVCFRVGHCINHLGVVTEPLTMFHVLRPHGADFVRFDVAPFVTRLQAIFRPVER